MKDLLFASAEVWNELLEYSYLLTYGKSGKLIHLELSFTKDRFVHIAGFQHLQDIQLPQVGSARKMYELVLAGKITEAALSQSQYYSSLVKPRLQAVLMLQQLLEGSFVTFLFSPQRLPFHTEIKAEYLIYGEKEQVVFLFTGKEGEGYLYPKSIFLKEDRDYTRNQTRLSLLKKERINRLTGKHKMLFCKDGFTE